MKAAITYASVPRLWPNATIVCLGGGPSLTRADVDACRGRAHVIAINDAYHLAPWADVLYACDRAWWHAHPDAYRFTGLQYSLTARPSESPSVGILKKTGMLGLDLDPCGLRTGHNGGYQAINLAVHLGASRIVLLGYDMQRGPNREAHWHPPRPQEISSPFSLFLSAFPSLVDPLKQAGVAVVNCSRRTALRCFPQAALADVLSASAVAA